MWYFIISIYYFIDYAFFNILKVIGDGDVNDILVEIKVFWI